MAENDGHMNMQFLFKGAHLGLHLSTHAENETRYIQYGQLLLFQ
jgi:hypothetical protein